MAAEKLNITLPESLSAERQGNVAIVKLTRRGKAQRAQRHHRARA